MAVTRQAVPQGWRRLALLTGVAALALPSLASAQQGLSAVILRGQAVNGQAARPGPTVLAPGLRVESPAGSWTEIAFSDGSSVVLEPGADFTLRGIERDERTGRLVVRAVSGRGQLRVSTSSDIDIVIVTPGAEVRVSSASAVVNAGPQGSASLTSGRSVTVRRADGREDVIRRPGFAVTFDDGGPRRQSREQIAQSVAPFAPVTATRGRQRQETVTEVAEAAGFDPTQDSAARNRSETVAPPRPSLPSAPQQPSNTPSGRRSAGAFDLAAGALGGVPSTGAAIAAPGVNSNTSVADSGTEIASIGQEGGLNLIGLESVQPQGTGRIRRFAPAVASGEANQRSDVNVVAPPSSALGGGQPASGVANAYFRNLAAPAGNLPTTQAQTFYDGVVRVGVVGLRVFEPPAQPPVGGGDPAGRELSIPRFYVTDQNAPSFNFYDAGYRVTRLDRQQQAFVSVPSPSGLDRFTPPELYARSGTIYVTRGLPDVIYVYRFDPSTGLETRVDPAAGQQSSNDGRAFSDAGFAAFRQNLVQTVPGELYIASAPSNSERFTVHRAGSVFEVEVQQRSSPTQPLAPPTPGRVLALSGGNGLAMQSGGAPLPGVSVVTQLTCCQDFQVGPWTGGFRVATFQGNDVSSPEVLAATTSIRPEDVPDVFIIDKISAGSEAIFNLRGVDRGERYFVIGGRPLAAPLNGSLPGTANGAVVRYAVSDGLNPNGNFAVGETIQSQFRGPGRADQPRAFNQFNAFRPEESFVSRNTPNVPRGDTHLLVVGGSADRNPALRVDVEVAFNGRTSAGVAVGSIARLPRDSSLALSGNLVGSSRNGDARDGSAAVISNLGSLGTDPTGYGAHVFGGNDAAPGQIGYFAVGEADTRVGAPGEAGGVQPGRIDNLGGSSSQFGFTRLATNVGTPDLGMAPGQVGSLQGFASSVVEPTAVGGGRQNLYAVAGSVTVDPRNGREFTAGLTLLPRALGEIFADAPAAEPPAGRNARTLSFGADSNGLPTTAVATPGTFAGVIPNQAAIASVNADLLNGIRRPDGSATSLPPSNEHLAWGFFLGDLVAQANGSPREYANLGFWVAGRQVDAAALQSLTGTATYSGGMIGNVVDGRGLHSVAGDFSHTFNFGSRQGTFNAGFDGAGFSIGTGLNGGTFTGGGAGDAGRFLSVQGGFFNSGAVSSGNLPRASGGIFGIAGPGYGANGVFVGARP